MRYMRSHRRSFIAVSFRDETRCIFGRPRMHSSTPPNGGVTTDPAEPAEKVEMIVPPRPPPIVKEIPRTTGGKGEQLKSWWKTEWLDWRMACERKCTPSWWQRDLP